ncbi:hypothetical protein OOT46_05650 [Aquabacterium sp. A7-Y]|uniref:DUF6708 domain-containing protein n=1 Tax=Aquabacterium sp. A7-Y TaxID=1349605 RepID=UPI00223D61BF|nr:DUF6708 domain-containing protein [Aquabacterium sp. A7-Y]MCW7537336.1 hypothetical protein [Aquabacterium sp. A7-Y]
MASCKHVLGKDLVHPGMLSVTERSKSAEHLSKKVQASNNPSSLGLVREAWSHALSLQMMFTGARGFVSIVCLAFLIGAAAICYWPFKLSITMTSKLMSEDGMGGYALVMLFMSAWMGGMALVAVCIGVRGLRMDLFGPKDVPLVFNKQTRKVYKYVQELPKKKGTGALNALKHLVVSAFSPWPQMLLIEYDWDCLEAEYFESTTLMGNVNKTLRVLQFYVKEHPTSQRVIDSFTVASPAVVTRSMSMDLWEYIRRYMEEDGPVMHKGDSPAPAWPTSLLQSAQAVAPYFWPLVLMGSLWSAYSVWQHGWPHDQGHFGPVVFIVGFISNFFLLAIVFNRLGYALGREAPLPPAVLETVGEPLDLARLAKEANAGAVVSQAAT